MKKNLKSLMFLTILGLAFFAANSCLALSLVDTSGNYSTGNYTLDDIRNYAVYLMRFILSLVGTLSLLAFVYGGMTFLLSAGNQESIKKGMGILKAAVVGLLITFSSVLIMNLFFSSLFAGTKENPNKADSSFNPDTGAVDYKEYKE